LLAGPEQKRSSTAAEDLAEDDKESQDTVDWFNQLRADAFNCRRSM
jgi:hypothetical protein